MRNGPEFEMGFLSNVIANVAKSSKKSGLPSHVVFEGLICSGTMSDLNISNSNENVLVSDVKTKLLALPIPITRVLFGHIMLQKKKDLSLFALNFYAHEGRLLFINTTRDEYTNLLVNLPTDVLPNAVLTICTPTNILHSPRAQLNIRFINAMKSIEKTFNFPNLEALFLVCSEGRQLFLDFSQPIINFFINARANNKNDIFPLLGLALCYEHGVGVFQDHSVAKLILALAKAKNSLAVKIFEQINANLKLNFSNDSKSVKKESVVPAQADSQPGLLIRLTKDFEQNHNPKQTISSDSDPFKVNITTLNFPK